MQFPSDVYKTLLTYSKAEEQLNVTLLNQYCQEFTITGFIPKSFKTFKEGNICRGLHANYFIFNFGKNDEHATIKIYCPETLDVETPPCLTIKEITDNYGTVIYTNSDYDKALERVKNHHIESHYSQTYRDHTSKEEELIKKYLGKAPIYTGHRHPAATGKQCLITGIIPGLASNSLAYYIRHSSISSNALVRVNNNSADKIFDLPPTNIDEIENENEI